MDHKYEEALKRAKQGLPIDEVFPELKESEDERIRKYIVKFVELEKGVNLPPDEADKMLAYLERQKEQKPVNLNDDITLGLDRALQIIKDAKGILVGYQTDDGVYECDHAIQTLEGILKNGIEHQPAEWSNDDEVMIKVLDSIIRYIVEVIDKDVLERFGTNYEELFSWLKSFRPRRHKWYIKKGHWYMCIVDKPEYGWTKGKVYQSPEDNRIETNYKGDLTNWPDSEPWFRPATREEIPDSQPHWKPSEEQMEALMWQIKNTSEGSWQRIVSEDLYNDLQKLL